MKRPCGKSTTPWSSLIRKEPPERMGDVLVKTFSLLKSNVENYPQTALQCIQTIGAEVFNRGVQPPGRGLPGAGPALRISIPGRPGGGRQLAVDLQPLPPDQRPGLAGPYHPQPQMVQHPSLRPDHQPEIGRDLYQGHRPLPERNHQAAQRRHRAGLQPDQAADQAPSGLFQRNRGRGPAAGCDHGNR